MSRDSYNGGSTIFGWRDGKPGEYAPSPGQSAISARLLGSSDATLMKLGERLADLESSIAISLDIASRWSDENWPSNALRDASVRPMAEVNDEMTRALRWVENPDEHQQEIKNYLKPR